MMNVKILTVQSNLVVRNFLVIAKLFIKARLFTIYEVNWQIGHGKWFNITNLVTI